MADALSDTTIELVKKTVPALEANGTAVTDRMYEILFRNSDIRDLVNQRITARPALSPRL